MPSEEVPDCVTVARRIVQGVEGIRHAAPEGRMGVGRKVRLVVSELRQARNQGAEDERQALLNWMRDPSHVEKGGELVGEMMDRLAGIIESGAHRDHDA